MQFQMATVSSSKYWFVNSNIWLVKKICFWRKIDWEIKFENLLLLKEIDGMWEFPYVYIKKLVNDFEINILENNLLFFWNRQDEEIKGECWYPILDKNRIVILIIR